MRPSVRRAQSAATGVGVLTLVLGSVLLGAPRTSARALGVDADPVLYPEVGLAAIGLVDLVVAAGLLAGRPRWPWMVARAAANPPSAAYLVALGRRAGTTAPVVAGLLVAGATVADVGVVRTLRAASR